MKRCPRCKQDLPLDNFHANRSMRDGKQANCKSCSNEVRREYEVRNAEVLALRRAERLARRVGPDETKQCRKCGEVKPLLSFYAHRSTKDRRANYCMECQKATTREWNKRNAERTRERNSAYRKANPDKRKRDHRQFWLRLYQLTQEDYAALLAIQNGTCAICEQAERVIDARTGEPRNLSVDHDHETGHVRGLLCGRCNRALGQFGDSVEVAQRAADYLRRAEKAAMQT